jgi:hypothetical protein
LAFAVKRTELQRKLSSATSLEMNAIIAKELINVFKVGESCDLFASERAKAGAKILEQLSTEHAGAVESGVIMHEPLASAWKRCCKRLEIDETLRSAAQVSTTSLVAAAGSGVGDAGSNGQAATAPKTDVLGQGSHGLLATPLNQYWLTVVRNEMRGNDFEALYLQKLLIAAATFELGKFHWMANTKSGHLCVKSKTKYATALDGKDKDHFEVSRERVGDDATSAEPDVALDFIGRVVDATTAAALGKQYCLPLLIAEGDGPPLFIDGTPSSNPKTSNLTFAWLIVPIPMSKKELTTALSSKDDPTKSCPVPKKARKSLEGDRFEIVATHEIKYVPFTIKIPGPRGEQIELEYTRPILINHNLAENTMLYGVPCYRDVTAWDLEEGVKKEKKLRSIRGFVLS